MKFVASSILYRSFELRLCLYVSLNDLSVRDTAAFARIDFASSSL